MRDDRQTAAAVLMVRPRHFRANVQTMASNAFQASGAGEVADLQRAALAEFDRMAQVLADHGLNVLVADDTDTPLKPDALFPNNWISTHADGTVILYAMEAPNRRPERREDIVSQFFIAHGFQVRRRIDLSGLEARGHFLEGTGSLVLDRPSGMAWAALSTRTHAAALPVFSSRTGYAILAFETGDAAGCPVYHTNVMLSLGSQFAVICTGAILRPGMRRVLLDRLVDGGRAIIEISLAQMAAFAGNLLELAPPAGPLIAVSARALAALDRPQRTALERHGAILPIDISTIEHAGGGSVRCMLAEVFLPRAKHDGPAAGGHDGRHA